MRILRWLLVVALLPLGFGVAAPASAAGGFATVKVTGLQTTGQVSDLPGATVVLQNLDTAERITLQPSGNPAVSPFYIYDSMPYGRYRVEVSRPGFITQFWPHAHDAATATPVWFGDAPDCDQMKPAPCPVHRLDIQLSEGIPLTGRTRLRDGRGVGNVLVTATRVDEPAYRPSTLSAADGSYAMALPPGAYTLSAAGRAIQVQEPVTLSTATTRDIVLLAPPGPVSAVTAAPGDSRLSVSWQPPTDDGGSPVAQYRAIATPGGAQCITTATGCTLEGLQNGQPYRISVTAENAIGPGEPSLASSPATPSVGLPGPVRNVRVNSGSRSLIVTWSAPARGEASEYVARALPGGRSCSTTDLECTIQGLTNGTAYRVEVTAKSDAGRTAPVAAAHRVRPAGPPGAPRAVTAHPISLGLRVTWNKPLDNGGHRIRRYVATVWPGGRTCTSRKHSCSVRGLNPRTHYSITVRARSSAGDGAISPGSIPVLPGH